MFASLDPGRVGANNLRFKMADQMLAIEPCGAVTGKCVSLADRSGHPLELDTCDKTSPAQKWTYSAANKTIRQGSQCFDAAPPAVSNATGKEDPRSPMNHPISSTRSCGIRL